MRKLLKAKSIVKMVVLTVAFVFSTRAMVAAINMD